VFVTIGILAHVDAGKTTLSENLLYQFNSIKERGRVDHQNTFLDHHAIERERGITIFAEQGRLEMGDDTYTIIDTPGHVDFSPEMERAIAVMDYAILVVSALDGVQGHTETVWSLLRKHDVPTFIFINKMDADTANGEAVLHELRQNLSKNFVPITNEFTNGRVSDQLIEWVAVRDEEILEKYFNQSLLEGDVKKAFQKMMIEGKAFPCAFGSALKDEGITEFFEQIMLLARTSYDEALPFSANVFKIRHDDKKQRITFMKAQAGKLSVRDVLELGGTPEKVTEIRLYNGNDYKVVKEVQAGEIFAVTGISNANIGDVVGTKSIAQMPFELIPTLQSTVVNDGTDHIKDVLACFRLLEAEDPSLEVRWIERFQEIRVHVMGAIQLEVLKEVAKQRFSLDIHFESPQVLYMETISNTVTGYGHFEPLKHYAEVHLLMEAAERGAGILFENRCHDDDLSTGHQRLIEHHIFERPHNGLLTGFPLTDVKFTLLTGRAHEKHTEGGDFREATFRAIRQGLEKASIQLLEPYYFFKMKTDQVHIGRMMTDVQQASGTFEAPIMNGNQAILEGRVPVSTFMDYSTVFAAYTNGKGAITLNFCGFDQCHNPEDTIERINYRKDADPEYSSSSIFCARGKGYAVPWEEAEQNMHCLKK